MKDCRHFSRVEAGDEKFSRRGLLNGLRDGQTPKASAIHLSIYVLGFEHLTVIQLGVRSPHAASRTSSHTAAWVLFSKFEECQTDRSCILSLKSKEPDRGCLDCLDKVVSEWSSTSDTI